MNAISIIPPCYNREYDLRRVLEAYDQQDTGIPFELIVVDDGSTDDSLRQQGGFVGKVLQWSRQQETCAWWMTKSAIPPGRACWPK